MSQLTGVAWKDRLYMQSSSSIHEVRDNAKAILAELGRLERELSARSATVTPSPELNAEIVNALRQCCDIAQSAIDTYSSDVGDWIDDMQGVINTATDALCGNQYGERQEIAAVPITQSATAWRERARNAILASDVPILSKRVDEILDIIEGVING